MFTKFTEYLISGIYQYRSTKYLGNPFRSNSFINSKQAASEFVYFYCAVKSQRTISWNMLRLFKSAIDGHTFPGSFLKTCNRGPLYELIHLARVEF